MKKTIYIISSLLLFIVLLVVFVFTKPGNALIKPYVEKYLSDKSSMDVKLPIFVLKFNKFELKAIVNSDINITSNGSYNIFSKDFDLKYELLSDKILNVQSSIDINGSANGNLNDFFINGSGIFAKSPLNFNAILKDLKLHEAKVKSKSLDLRVLSLVLLKNDYLRGYIDINADIMDNFKKGNAKINSDKVTLNNDLIKELHEIVIPSNFYAVVNSDIEIKNGIANAKSIINSPFGKIFANKSIYDFNRSKLKTDLNLDIENLALLESITKQKFKGKIKANANLELENGNFKYINGDIHGLGGLIKANYENNDINAEIKNIKLEEILKLNSITPFAKANINGIIRIKQVNQNSQINGDANLQFSKALLLHKELNKLLDSNLKKDISILGDLKTEIRNENVTSSAILNSPFIRLAKIDLLYNLSKKNGSIKTKIDISQPEFIFGSEIKDDILLNADLNIKDNKIDKINADFKGFGGKANAIMSQNTLKANINNINSKNILLFTPFDNYFDGKINSQININDINMQNLNGQVKLDIKDAVFNETHMSKLLNKNFPKNVKFNLNSKTTLTNSIAYFNSNFNSNLIDFKKFSGSFDINKNILNADFTAFIEKMQNFAFLTSTELFGPLNLNGKITYNQNLKINANSDIAQSKTTAVLENNKIKINMNNFEVKKVLEILRYDGFYTGNGDLVANYDIETNKGNFDIDIKNGKITPNDFTTFAKTFLNRDLTQETYKTCKINGTINGDLTEFDLIANSQKSDIKVTKGKIKGENLNIPVKANIEKTDISIDIKGTKSQPKYNFGSNYLKQKGNDLIEQFIKDDESKNGLKNLLNNLL